jgi:hypothetical protein
VEKYIESLKMKQKWAVKVLVVSIILQVALIIANIIMKENVSVLIGIEIDFILAYLIGASIGLWVRWQQIQENNDKLLKNYYEVTDERLILIKRKTDEITAYIIFISMLLVSILLIGFNSLATNTLMLTAIFGTAVYHILKIYYKFKL